MGTILKHSNPYAIPDAARPPQQFWIDFGNFVGASKNGPDTDEYWRQLVKWADILMKRYNNTVANHIVMDYLDGQSKRSIDAEQAQVAF